MAVNGIIGKKVGMTQLFDEKGDVRPVTILQAGPCVVTQRKTATRDGYDAAQIGLVECVKGAQLTRRWPRDRPAGRPRACARSPSRPPATPPPQPRPGSRSSKGPQTPPSRCRDTL